MEHRRFLFPLERSVYGGSTSAPRFVTGASLVLAVAIVALGAGPVFAQPRPVPTPAPVPIPPPPETAADLAKQGIELYKAGDYPGAVAILKRAHELEPNVFTHRFALAQALRQAGSCDEAVPHYKALIEAAPDPALARDIRSSMAACPEASADTSEPPPPPVVPPPPAAPPPPVASGGISRSNAALMVGAGASLTAAVLLFAGSRLDRGDAERARSADEFERISGRADSWLAASVVTAGAGVGLAVVSYLRYRRSRARGTELAISPRAGGGVAVVLGSSF